MSLSPQDVAEVELRQAMRGYAVADVDDLLRRVAETLQARDGELAELRSRLEAAEAKVAEAESSQHSIQQALVTAHTAAEQTIRKAQEEAEELREGARRDLDVDADQARREVERIVEDGRAAQQRQREEFETAQERLQAAYDQQRAELGGRLDALREQLVVCEGFLRSHIEEQEQALDRILDRIDEAGESDPPVDHDPRPGDPDPDPGPEGPESGGPDPDPETDRPEPDPGPDGPENDGPDTDELPRVDVDAALAGSSHAPAEQDPVPADVAAADPDVDPDGGGQAPDRSAER